MQRPAQLTASDALFLDFDGTLVDLAERPELVRVKAGLPDLLAATRHRLGGALALVSGRPIGELDRSLAPFRSVAAGLHGLEWRVAPDAEVSRAACRDVEALSAAVREGASALSAGVWVEDKAGCVAIHFRAAPHAVSVCRAFADALAERFGLEVLSGKMVFEVRPAGVDKGQALARLMALDGFAGRRPVFVGDDVTDEDAFAVARSLGGYGIKVGCGGTTAEHRFATVAEVEGWLAQASGPRG